MRKWFFTIFKSAQRLAWAVPACILQKWASPSFPRCCSWAKKRIFGFTFVVNKIITVFVRTLFVQSVFMIQPAGSELSAFSFELLNAHALSIPWLIRSFCYNRFYLNIWNMHSSFNPWIRIENDWAQKINPVSEVESGIFYFLRIFSLKKSKAQKKQYWAIFLNIAWIQRVLRKNSRVLGYWYKNRNFPGSIFSRMLSKYQ